ncbi:hypothetical protein R6Q59_012210 [Mikania micrantha]
MSFWDVNFFFGDDKIEQDFVGRFYYGDNTKIPLAGVDIFLTKLDTRPLFLDEEEINVEEQLQAVKQQIMTQPTKVKKSMMKKILATAFPGKSDKKPPVVQKDVRRHPSSKVQQQKKKDSQHSVIDQPRHSSYTHSKGLKIAKCHRLLRLVVRNSSNNQIHDSNMKLREILKVRVVELPTWRTKWSMAIL